MTGLWVKHLEKFADTLARPSRTWSEAEADELWRSVAGGPLGHLLYCFVSKRVNNLADAEDILYKCLGELAIGRNYIPQGEGLISFRAWVYACLRKHMGKFVQRQQRRQKLFEHSIDDAAGAVADTPGDDGGRESQKIEAHIDAMTAVATLPPQPRAIMTRTMLGETDDQIAQATCLTKGNVRQIRFRAMRDLRKRFGISIPAAS